MGTLTIDAREKFLSGFIAIQDEVNFQADINKMPRVDFLNREEIERIIELQTNKTWPDGWSGDEPLANILHHRKYSDGSVMENLFAEY